jgi:hypothetical protein
MLNERRGEENGKAQNEGQDRRDVSKERVKNGGAQNEGKGRMCTMRGGRGRRKGGNVPNERERGGGGIKMRGGPPTHTNRPEVCRHDPRRLFCFLREIETETKSRQKHRTREAEERNGWWRRRQASTIVVILYHN